MVSLGRLLRSVIRVFDDCCPEHSDFLAGAEHASCRPARPPLTVRRIQAVLTVATMPSAITAPPVAFTSEERSWLFWLPLIGGLIAGAALAFCLAQNGDASSVPVAPANGQAAPLPAPLGPAPDGPPIRFAGLLTAAPMSDVSAPFRGSAAVLRRDGDPVVTETLLLLSAPVEELDSHEQS